jgi:DNA-binding NarL/FixJ family response regulator
MQGGQLTRSGGDAIRNGMSGVSLPVTRATGRGLLVGSPASRAEPAEWLRRLGCTCVEMDDPYAAMAELAQRPLAYSSLVLSLSTMFGEELQIIPVVKRRFPNVEVWLMRGEGMNSALDEALRLGADGFLAEDGMHRMAQPAADAVIKTDEAGGCVTPADEERPVSEPVLSAEELRALLDDPPLT